MKKEKQLHHNWTIETLGKCAEIHLDFISRDFFNYFGRYKYQQILKHIESFDRIRKDVMAKEAEKNRFTL